MGSVNVVIAAEVQEALHDGLPVVALESTLITHGMPYPHNLDTALALESAVRDAGAVPATIAIINGEPTVGLSEAALYQLAQTPNVIKCSRRDLAWVVAKKSTGSTTVAGTMVLAHQAGIAVFATGGIGGVHRGATETMDVSADLLELARTPVAVVCAGVKSILDITLTLEVLETHGVPVVGLGCDRFPAFYVQASDCPVPLRLDSPDEVARLLNAQRRLGLQNGTIVAVPIPTEHALDHDVAETAIQAALDAAKMHGIHGKALTPFLLDHINRGSEGRSLAANKALVLNNARTAAAIAHAWSTLERT
jgi:pseudouridine-5'-phosphate glycosidase